MSQSSAYTEDLLASKIRFLELQTAVLCGQESSLIAVRGGPSKIAIASLILERLNLIASAAREVGEVIGDIYTIHKRSPASQGTLDAVAAALDALAAVGDRVLAITCVDNPSAVVAFKEAWLTAWSCGGCL